MAPEPPSLPANALGALDDEEVEALVSAGAWYAKYHQDEPPRLAGDRSALAVSRREHFESLYSALEKLGVRMRRPEGLEQRAVRLG